MKSKMDPYALCRHVRHYHEKNGFAPLRSELGCSEEEAEALIRNGILQVLPLYEGGPPIVVVLTDKGYRMAQEKRKAK
jgi:hypothetical protein